MSGISGFYNLDGRPAERVRLHQMATALAHRGPDGTRLWTQGAVALAHLMLGTTPESQREFQPLTSEDGALCLTLDGRIDNRKELIAALEQRGFHVRDNTDAEVVLRAYECWGDDCPPRLLGDFAFALWDSRLQRLFCARDYVGVRPFYYYHSPAQFAFASEICGLLALDAVPRALDESRLADFLVEELDCENKQSTFYRHIRRLPAGHCLMVEAGRITLRDYWNLQAPPVLRLRSDGEYGEAFRAVFTEAVRCRLRSRRSIGSTLSGGLDSSAVVCTVRELCANQMQEPLRTVSLADADSARCGETPYIQEIIAGGNLVPHILQSHQVPCFSRLLAQAIAAADEPFELGRYFFNWLILASARRAGIAVLLDGIDADLLIPDYHYLSTLIRSGDFRTLGRELAFAAALDHTPRWRIAVGYGLIPIMPGLYLQLRRLLRRKPPAPGDALIAPEFAARMNISDRLLEAQRKVWTAARDLGSLHCLSFSSAVVTFFLEHTGRMAAACGVEPRHPFLDRRVIEFFLSLPLHMKSHVPLPKMVIRTGMAGVMPEKVRWRNCYAHPAPAFLEALLERRAELFSPASLTRGLELLEGYASMPLLEELRSGPKSSGPSTASRSTWQLLNLAAWLGSRELRPDHKA